MKIAAFFLAALCLAAPAGAQGSPENYHAEAGVMLWKPSPDIIITSGTLGTPVDFVNTFAVEDKWFADVRVVLKPARKHKLRFSATPITYESTQTLTQTIRFRGQTYTVGLPTTASLKWTLMRAGYEWDPIVTERGFAGLFFDLKYNKLNAELSAPLVMQTYARKVPVPTIGGIWRGYLTRSFAITAEFTGLKFDHGDLNAKLYDLDLYGTANVGRNVGAQFGYRSVTVDYTSDTDTGNLKLKGPYLGALVRF